MKGPYGKESNDGYFDIFLELGDFISRGQVLGNRPSLLL